MATLRPLAQLELGFSITTLLAGMRSIFVWIILLTALSFEARVQAQDGFAVQGIKFSGNKSISSGILGLLMETKSVGGFARIFGKRGPEFSSDVLTQDLDRIKSFYQREGFLDAKIGAVSENADKSKKTVKLVIPVDEGRPIRIRAVTYTLTPPTNLAEDAFQRIVKNFTRSRLAAPQSRFRDSAVMLDQLALVRAMGNIGYPYATAAPELSVSRADFLVDLNWKIASGPRCVFGDLRVVGVTQIPGRLIERQSACHIGDTFRLRLVEQSQQQVYGLGVFQVATVTPTFTASRDSVVPVEIFVKDSKRFTTKLGLGYGTEDQFRVFSESKFLGFMGGARALALSIKHSYLEPYHVTATVTQPAFPTPRTTVSVSPFLWRQREPSFTVNRFGGSIGAVHQFSRRLGGSVTYSLEQVKVDQSILTAVLDSSGLGDVYNKSQIIFGSSFDNSGPMFNPRHGFYNANSFAISGLGFGSKTRYTKLLIDLRRYQPLSLFVFATRIKLGGIRPYGDASVVPVEERFYSGGSSSVRGWARSELGPLEAGIPVGGLSLLEGSAELRFPIVGILSGVVFGDLGNVWTESYTYKLAEIRYAAGAGIRITTPIGPIRLDVARPVADIDKKIQIHVSVGQAF